jgi:hypothetical protein
MTSRHVRQVCAAAIAVASGALLPTTAEAHCIGPAGLADTPTAAQLTDFSGDYGGCTSRFSAYSAGFATASNSMFRPPASGKKGAFKLVGQNPLLNRGMNAAIAIKGDYAYIGSRTDLHPGTPHGGVMVLDISRPNQPELLGQPIAAMAGESTRELRVWQSQNVLIVLNTNCGVGDKLHHCTTASVSNIRFYDIAGRNAKAPRLLHDFKVDTHEFFLWEDPRNPKRALIFAGNAAATCGTRGGAPSCPFSVWDISAIREGKPPVTLFTGPHGFTTGGLHSLTVTNDGRRAYFALLTGGFAIVDTSDFAAGKMGAQPRPITVNEARPTWPGPGAHSAVKLWGRDWAWVSDEVYGSATAPDHGCPWGWARMLDISKPDAPAVRAEYREPENVAATCNTWNPPRTSYSAHNPTLTPHVAFSTWHSGGLQAVSLKDPRRPYQLAEFTPKPLKRVQLEDPRLSSDPDTGRNEKVVMWSYAIVKDGLIYVVDLRNGLYVLSYRGAYEDEVQRIRYLDGNSNQGDALCFEPVGRAARGCR